MTGSNDFIICWPFEISNSLGMIFELLKEIPWIDIFKVSNFINMDVVVLFGGYSAVVSLVGESYDGDSVVL